MGRDSFCIHQYMTGVAQWCYGDRQTCIDGGAVGVSMSRWWGWLSSWNQTDVSCSDGSWRSRRAAAVEWRWPNRRCFGRIKDKATVDIPQHLLGCYKKFQPPQHNTDDMWRLGLYRWRVLSCLVCYGLWCQAMWWTLQLGEGQLWQQVVVLGYLVVYA